MMKKFALALLVAFGTIAAEAHPISYKDALSIMSWNRHDDNEMMVTYTFARQAAAAAMYHRMIIDGTETQYYGPQFNYLIKRWNELGSQGNVYVTAGAGGFELGDRQRTAGAASVEADWETTKVYFSARFMGHFPEIGGNIYMARYRAGVSAYPFEFHEMSAWAILDIAHNPRMEEEVSITPLLRLFYRNMLLETGSSFRGDWLINFMVHLYPPDFKSKGEPQ